MRRVRFVVAYDGRNYRGSQIQPGVPTVQNTLECALRKVRAFRGRTTFAGRTDAGVHAFGQLVSCDVGWEGCLERLRHGLTSVLPTDVRILSCEPAAASFNARFDSISREYRYRVVTDHVVPPHLAGLAWARRGILDDERASAAAARFVGSHSFGSFASAGLSQERSRHDLQRTVAICDWRMLDSDFFALRCGASIYELRIIANGFLPQMVRNVVSAVVEVGSGNQPQEWIEYLLVSGDRRLLGPPAPPHGLFLWHVEYADGVDRHTGNSV